MAEVCTVPAALLFPIFLFPVVALAQTLAEYAPIPKTLFVDCDAKEKFKSVLSAVSYSEDRKWRAYVEVDVRTGCEETSRLWVAPASGPYRVMYTMSPEPTAVGNGMTILGWGRQSSMLLARTLRWQDGSDAMPFEQVFALDARNGRVYEPQLDAMVEPRKGKQCDLLLKDAGFGAETNVILVRARFRTAVDEGDTESDVPPAKRCGDSEETWSFNFGNGDIRRVTSTEPLRLFRTGTQPHARDGR